MKQQKYKRSKMNSWSLNHW